MKLSSSTLCGCCFCCYCHCWLMMLLMVSSVVHVSPEMSTTTTNPTNPTFTTNKKYIKLYNNINNNNNHNNYAYQSEMTEFIQLNNRKLEIPNRTSSKTVATIISTKTTTSSPSSTLFSLPATPEVTTSSSDDYVFEENNVQSYPLTTTTERPIELFEHEAITTIATIQTTQQQEDKEQQRQQQALLSTRLNETATTTQVATSPATIISTLTTTPAIPTAPEQIQMLQEQLQSNLYEATTTTNTATTIFPNEASKQSKRQFVAKGVRNEEELEQEDVLYMYDNSIEQEENEGERFEEVIATTMTTNNYVADNSNVLVPPTIATFEPTTESFVKPQTITKSLQQPKDYKSNNSRKMATKYWNPYNKSKQKQQYNNESQSRTKYTSSSNIDNSLNNSESNTDFINSNNEQKKLNTFSLNHHKQQHFATETNNQIPQLHQQSQLEMKLQQYHFKTASKTTIETRTTTDLKVKSTINTLTTNGTNSTTTTTHNSTQIPIDNNKSNNIYITSFTAATSYDSVSNLNHPKEIMLDSDVQGNHLQIPTTSVGTTTLRTPVTYAPLYQYHAGFNQLRRPALLQYHPHHRHTRQAAADDEQNDKCRMFVEGDAEKNELYSPDYPNDYPKNINCTRVIIAPKGQIIRLDFRNSFHIEEKEECKFDFLEIRDGQYGFSNLIGKYCGTDFPPEITSKERYLWLHFHSDESIEYSGFTAVYEFIDRNRDAPSTDLNCTIERDGFEGFVNASDVPAEIKETVIRNKIPLDCMWRIQVQEKWKIQVKFVDFKLAKPNDCETNFLDIFPEQTVMPLRVKNFCGSAGEGITSESNILHVRFYAEQSAINSTFSILYTAFRERGSSSCAEDEYDCEDATCIAGNLKCNGRSNCKFLWDEEGCKLEDNGQSEHMIIIITVFGLILGGMVITFLVNCVRKIMHDQKIIREHIRQSKESKLDEMGRNSKGRSRDNISIVSPRQKHSQTSLQILDDVSNRYYRELEMQTKGNFKEKDPSILRHDMIVQTSLCSTDDSSTTITEQTPPTAAVGSNACDMGCQTRESLFATASLMRQKSKTPSIGGGQHTIEGVPPPPRFSTFGYDAAHIAPPPPPTVSTLSRRNMHLPQESLEMEQLPAPQQTAHTMMTMMPQQQQQQQQLQQQHHTPQQQHQHLHHRPSQEICHHHHQHQQHLQKQTLPRHHQQQQQPQHHQHMQQQQQQPQHHHQHHTTTTTIPPNVAQIPAPGTAIVTAISTGSSGRQREQQQPGVASVKGKQTKVDESKVFIDIRNSAPDVIIMTSH